MDDVVVEFDDSGSHRTFSIQAKRKIQISAAPSNADFREVLVRALTARSKLDFHDGLDAYGFAVEILLRIGSAP